VDKDAVLNAPCVTCTTIWLARWQCRKCDCVFTDYPAFVLPYKRYAGFTLLHKAALYLEDAQQTYRKTTGPQGWTTGYVTPPGAPAIVERKLDHSTIWRMLGWLGSEVAALLAGIPVIQDGSPRSTCHPLLGTLAPHKFRSPERERVLCQARQLLDLIANRENPFPEKFLPRNATRSGFG